MGASPPGSAASGNIFQKAMLPFRKAWATISVGYFRRQFLGNLWTGFKQLARTPVFRSVCFCGVIMLWMLSSKVTNMELRLHHRLHYIGQELQEVKDQVQVDNAQIKR